MKTKIIALLLAMVVMVGAFASCGLGGSKEPGNDPNNNSGSGNNTDVSGTDKRPWGETTLIFELNENSNKSELASTSRRYLAGDMSTTTEGKHAVDTLVAARNAKAYAEANVRVEYKFLPEEGREVWGQNINRINEQVTSGAASAPDIYCNFVYDMVAASLKGSFANLLSTTMENKDGTNLSGAEHNYFTFAYEIDMKDDGKDYMTEYMRSLTLSKTKMYCLSSDYFTDMVRAFFVVPVNITMLETLKVSNEDGQYNSDRADATTGEAGKDGKFTIEDFYQLVEDGEWTYETLAAYSQAIYVDSNTAVGGEDLGDQLGFALATSSGLSASGMLYTTSIVIIDRKMDLDKGEYTYSYPGTEKNPSGAGYIMSAGGEHKELENFCTAISNLFQANGVLAIGDEEATQAGKASALLAIREKFANNSMLFGGVICLGSLEYHEYKDMNAKGKGYGIAPVPLYRGEYTNAQGETQRDQYLTQIHNIGRIGAISYTTKKFAQCTYFLDYQCMNSNEILTTYYDYKLQYEVGNSEVKGNVEMLKYIRNNVRSSFDKAYEDALGIFYSEATANDSQKQIWHYIIKDSGYTIDGETMGAYYDMYAPIKAQRLYDLENSTFPSLPN